MLGTTLRGRYKIIRNLGRGGFSETYVAEDLDLPGTPVCVVKRLKPYLNDPLAWQAAIRFFNKEAEALYKLGNHEQIPRLLAHFEENQEFYLVQEFVNGNDLSRELSSGKRWSEDEVIDFLHDVLEVLEFVHQQNVIHRDIKPANLIRRAADGKIVLIDFGAVKEINTLVVTPQGNTTLAIGTPGYMPSEQNSGHPKFSSDIYAIGMTAIQALTGMLSVQLPKDPNTHETIWRDRVQISPQLADVLDKMIRYDFRQRYQSTSEVLHAVNSLRKVKNKSDKKPTLYIGLGVGVAVVAIAVILLTRPEIKQIFVPGPSPEIVNSSEFETYENPEYRIKLEYPKNWTRQDLGSFGDVVTFLAPQTQNNSFQAELHIEVISLPSKMTLPEYTTSRINEIIQNLPGARIIDSRPTKLADLPAHEVVYSGKEGQIMLTRKAIWMLKDRQAYILTYTAQESQYEEFLSTAQKTIDSFEIN
ncbi:MAG: protein kinase [Cyanosarcina radialis HA8281-LM2]|jgi:serine/threonine-protein kinase|nr:protein kinase [Cyanosarcina radialis HA8281-LM2]